MYSMIEGTFMHAKAILAVSGLGILAPWNGKIEKLTISTRSLWQIKQKRIRVFTLIAWNCVACFFDAD